jgi:formate hydrogenlyase transcriptional activator
MLEYVPDSGGQPGAETVSGHGERSIGDAERTDGEILLAIADLVVGTGVLHELFRKLVPSLRELAKCDVVSFSLYDAKQNDIVSDFWNQDEEAGFGKTFPLEESPCGWVWQHQEPLRIPDLDQETRFPGFVQELRKRGLRCCAVLPMSTPRHRYGALGIGVSRPDAESLRNLVFLARAARLVGLAVENHQVHSQWQKQRRRLQSLTAIGRELSKPDLEQMMPAVFARMRQTTECDYARLGLLDAEARSLRVQGVDTATPAWVQLREGQSIPLASAISARAIEMRRVTFHGAEELAKFTGAVAGEIRGSGVQSLCSVPLMLGHRVIGAMILGAVRKNAFSYEDGEYLQQAGAQIGVALHMAGAVRDVTRPGYGIPRKEQPLESEIDPAGRPDEIVGHSPALKRVLEHAAVVAQTDATVLITGETGTGKERVARAIHRMSRRKDNAFIKVNCAAIPTGLLESELFGHEKGAFTGAVSQKVGRLELADQGTLLLDEVGEIPLELQPKLLRVLQDQEFERLGGTRTIRVDVRLIAASNRDLERAVEERQFRSDLFYRLHVFPLHLPALRERREDIPLLIRHCVEKCSARLKKRIDCIPDEVVAAMMNLEWPGNIRELENFIERSVILSEGSRLRPAWDEPREPVRPPALDWDGTLRDRERSHIVEMLRRAGGVLSGPAGAAAKLGLKRTTLQYKVQRLGISRHEYLD